MELLAPGSTCRYCLVVKDLLVDTFIRLRPDNLREPPRADPHAGWCGEGEKKLPLTRLGVVSVH